MRGTIRAVLVLAALSAQLAWAQTAVQEYVLKIERSPLKSALIHLSKQTELDLSFLIKNPKHGNALIGPLDGRYTIEAALNAMSADASVIFVRVNDHTISVAAKDPPKLQSTRLADKTMPVAQPRASRAAGDDGSADNARTGSRKLIVEEIVVTAQKREERLQDVPISISVLGGVDLDRRTAEGITQVLNRAPGVVTTTPIQGGAAQLTIRGVSAGGAFFNGSSPIAYYLDSMPFGLVKTAVVPDSNGYDLERIEVLRGPQGTLYGASAQNGVVRVLTKDAVLDDFEIKARTTLSKTEHGGENWRGDMAINAPIVDGKLAARAVVGYENLSGWIDKPNQEDANDAQLRNIRIKLNAKPGEQWSAGLSAWLSRSDYGGASIADANRRRTSTADESIAADYDVYGLRIGYDADGYSVTSNTSSLEYRYGGALDLLPFVTTQALLTSALESEVFSQEFLVNSLPRGAWRWSLGGIYRNAQDRLVQVSPYLSLPIDFTDRSKSFAFFGQLTRVFLDGKFEVTAGLRHFEDRVTQIENVPQTGNPSDPLLPPDTSTFDAVSPRVVLAWHPVADATIYASYSEGFRSGFNQNANITRVAPEYPPVNSDTLKNYEIGAKGMMAEGVFGYEVAVYYVDWQDVQQTLTVEFGEVPTSVLVNGESASGLGAEFAFVVRPLDGLDLGVSLSWNDLAVDSSLVTAGLPLYNQGDRLNFSSKYTAGASADYAFAFGSNFVARLSASASHVSNQSYRNFLGSSVVTDVGEKQTIARTSVSIDSSQGWTVTAFVDNLTDEDAPGVGLFHVAEWQPRPRPRTAGLQVEYRF